MMFEYDRLSRTSPRPARLRLFLFPLHNNNSNLNFALTDSKPERQWFVDALNSVPVPLLEGSSPPPTAAPNPDFLFGLDKPPAAAAAPEAPPKNPSPESECFSEDRPAVRDTETETGTGTERVPEPEIRMLQIGNNNEQVLQQKMKIEEDNNGRVYGVNGAEAFSQTNTENVTPLVGQGFHSGTVSFLQARNNNVGYSLAVPTTGSEIYLIQTPSGILQAVRPVTGPVGQPVYLVPAPSSVGVTAEGGYSAGQGGARW